MTREYKQNRIDDIVAMIELEFVSATRKFGAFHNGHEGFAVIREELDELWDAVKVNETDDACREAIQVSAMGLRFAFDLLSDEQWEKLRKHYIHDTPEDQT